MACISTTMLSFDGAFSCKIRLGNSKLIVSRGVLDARECAPDVVRLVCIGVLLLLFAYTKFADTIC